MVSTNPPLPFVIDLYRLGYYGGKGGRHLGQLGPFKGRLQPEPGIGQDKTAGDLKTQADAVAAVSGKAPPSSFAFINAGNIQVQ